MDGVGARVSQASSSSSSRIEALGGRLVAQRSRDYDGFRKRLRKRLVALDRLKINYAPGKHLGLKRGLAAIKINHDLVRRNAHIEYERAMRHKGRRAKTNDAYSG